MHWNIVEQHCQDQLGLCNSSWVHIKAIPVSWPTCCLGFAEIFLMLTHNPSHVLVLKIEATSCQISSGFLTEFSVNANQRRSLSIFWVVAKTSYDWLALALEGARLSSLGSEFCSKSCSATVISDVIRADFVCTNKEQTNFANKGLSHMRQTLA